MSSEEVVEVKNLPEFVDSQETNYYLELVMPDGNFVKLRYDGEVETQGLSLSEGACAFYEELTKLFHSDRKHNEELLDKINSLERRINTHIYHEKELNERNDRRNRAIENGYDIDGETDPSSTLCNPEC